MMGQGNSETTSLKVLPVSTDTVSVIFQDEHRMEPPNVAVGCPPAGKRGGVLQIASTKRPPLRPEQPATAANYAPAA